MRQRTIKLADGLNERLEQRMRELDRSANWIIARALERELGGQAVASETHPAERPTAPSVPSRTPAPTVMAQFAPADARATRLERARALLAERQAALNEAKLKTRG